MSKPAKPPAKIKLITNAGETHQYSQGTDRHLLWHVVWQSADITTINDVPTVGEMKSVRGEIGAASNQKSFRAEQAFADKAKNTLTLTGGVSIEYPKNDARMKCDKLVYDANLKRFDAKGDVSLVSKNTEVKGVPEVMADSEFDQIASPDMFQEKK